MTRRLVPAQIAVALLVSALPACTNTSHTGANDPTQTASPSAVLPLRTVLPQIEAFVERERGLTFKHPVSVSVLGKQAFLKQFHKAEGAPSAKDVEKTTAILAALGLVSPTVDLSKAFSDAQDAGTLGFYSNKTKKLYVRGDDATPGVRAVLAHELTHALTDQWFGLRRPQLDNDTQELELGFDALVEGDAERTRTAYEATMSPADQRLAKQQESGDTVPPAVPQVVLELIGAPYIVGPQFVDAVVARGGIPALNHAYRHPPTSSEQLFNPAAYFSGDNPKHVNVPRANGPVVEHGDLGWLGLVLTLENGVDRATVLQDLAGWGGDQFVVWRSGDHQWCLRDTVVMDNSQAAVNVQEAISEWVASRNGAAQLERQGAKTTFRSCTS